MKIIEVDDELYQYIASKTENIGEQASDILRRLLGFDSVATSQPQQGQPQEAQAGVNEAPQTASKDEEIEVVIPAEVESAKVESQVTVEADIAAKQNDNQIAEPQAVYDVESTEQSAAQSTQSSDDDGEVKTTTVKAQEAKHAQINDELEDTVAVEANDESQAEIKESAPVEKTPVEKSSAKTARKVKARRTPKAKAGPSDEQLAAPVKGLDLPLIAENNSVVKRFLYILSSLEQKHGANFDRVLEVQGKGRLYFATSEQELSDAGYNTNPKQIGKSKYWVMTNSNTDRKKQMLTEVSKILGYSAGSIETLVAKL